MNTDIRLYVDFFNNRKTKKLERLLGDSGVLSLLKLWLRVSTEKPCGILDGWDEEDIAIESGFNGDQSEFVEALLSIGFMEIDGGSYKLRNWEERQPWACSSKDRSDRGRMCILAKKNKKEFERLKGEGITAITREQYDEIMSPSYVEVKSSLSTTKVEVKPSLSPVPSPIPSPLPEPLPEPLPIPSPIEKTDKVLPDVCVSFSKDFYSYLSDNGGKKNPTTKDINSGAETIEKLIRLDGWGLEDEIRPALQWAVKDHFWGKQVRSLAPLRKKSKGGEAKFANIFAAYSTKDNVETEKPYRNQSQIDLENIMKVRRNLHGKSDSTTKQIESGNCGGSDNTFIGAFSKERSH